MQVKGIVTESFRVGRGGEDDVDGQANYNQCQEEIEEFHPKKDMVLKRLGGLDQELEKSQLKNGQHE